MPIHGSFGGQHLEPLENLTFRRISRTTGHSNTLCLSTEWWLVVSDDGYIQTTWVHHWPKVPNFCDVTCNPCNSSSLYPFPNWHTSETFSEKSSFFPRKIHFAKRETSSFFSTFQPRETTGPGWYLTNGKFLRRRRTIKSGETSFPHRVSRLKIVVFSHFVTSLWPDSMMSELVLCCQKLSTKFFEHVYIVKQRFQTIKKTLFQDSDLEICSWSSFRSPRKRLRQYRTITTPIRTTELYFSWWPLLTYPENTNLELDIPGIVLRFLTTVLPQEGPQLNPFFLGHIFSMSGKCWSWLLTTHQVR